MSINIVKAKHFQNKYLPRAKEHIFQDHPTLRPLLYSLCFSCMGMYWVQGEPTPSLMLLPFRGRPLNNDIIPKDVKFELSDPSLV
jgi:hypothetical protein